MNKRNDIITNEDTTGFLTTQRIEAIVDNLVKDKWIAYVDEPQRFPSLPSAVTAANWPELENAGWQWLDNVSNDDHGNAIAEGVRNRHRVENALVGWPWDRDNGRPIDDPSREQFGVYVLEILDMI